MPLLRDTKGALGSPDLLQHADNPVNWYLFGDDAFVIARQLDRPVFISIGYSACHWCHVMAHESFEDPETAALLNANFIYIKVDRKERPDVDAIYMEAVHALGLQGGWPLSAFTTPEGRPFFGGTYFPKVSRAQMPAFTGVLDAIALAWRERRASIVEQADELTDAVDRRLTPPTPGDGERPRAELLIAQAVTRIAQMFDPEYGGIGNAPKFPQGPMLELLLRAHLLGDERALPMVTKSLEAIAAGGIYDHLGGGFSRDSVDREWLVPHFERMLSDQATLARLYLHAWQVTHDERWLQVSSETIDYVLRELVEEAGGITSAQDADSEGEEGRYYTWTREEVNEALDVEAADAIFAWYGDLTQANFEGGRSILHRPLGAALRRTPAVEHARRELAAYRSGRVRPGRDDNVITAWNAMFASMLCEAAAATGNDRWRQTAVSVGAFIATDLRRDDGRLVRSSRDGHAQHLAMATDYAWTIDLFTRLNELTGRAHYLATTVVLADQMIDLFGAPGGSWYLNGSDEVGLILRPVDSFDGVTPAAGSIATTALARLGAATGEERFSARRRATLEATAAGLMSSPAAFAHLVGGAALIDGGTMEIVLGPGHEGLLGLLYRRYLPDLVLVWGEPTPSPLWEGRGDARVYLCHHGVCQRPVTSAEELFAQIEQTLERR